MGFDYAGHQLFAGEHAAAAVEDQRVVAEVLREVGAGADVCGEGFSGFSAEPARELFAAYVFVEGRVGAGFGYEHFVVRAEFFYRLCAFDEDGELALGARHDYRERGERHFARQDFIDLRKDLRVCDDERGRLFERV